MREDKVLQIAEVHGWRCGKNTQVVECSDGGVVEEEEKWRGMLFFCGRKFFSVDPTWGVAHDALPKSQTSSKLSMQVCVCVNLSSKFGCVVQVWPMPTLEFVREYRTEPPSGPLTSKSKYPFGDTR